VFLLPIIGGFVLFLLVALVSYPPLLRELQERRTAIAALKSQEQMLPLLRRQLDATSVRHESLTNQQTRLLTLVAGTGELKTLLASINDVAAASGLSITLIEPGMVERPSAQPVAGSTGATPNPSPEQQAVSGDPLLVANLEKRSAQITVRGSYPALRSFLQRLESLQVVAIASELELRAAPPNQQAASVQKPGQPSIELKLKLNAYGRAPVPSEQNAISASNPPG
jgi:Tfp pilus assembly protein PilO